MECDSWLRAGMATNGSGPRYLEIIPYFTEVVVQKE